MEFAAEWNAVLAKKKKKKECPPDTAKVMPNPFFWWLSELLGYSSI